MLDLVITKGRLVIPPVVLDRYDLGIADARIVAIAPSGTLPAAAQTFDAAGRHVLPGLIDPHTHPGNWRAFEDDIRATTRSAAAGGITSIFSTVKSARLAPPFHELTKPEHVVSYLGVFPEGRAAIERSALGDVGLSFMITTDEQAADVPRYVSELGVRSFKFHPAASLGPWHERIGFPIAADDGTIFTALEHIARTGALAMVHAENGQVVRALRRRVEAAGHTGLLAWRDGSPDVVEASEIRRMAFFCRAVGAPLYVAHLSSKLGLETIREARSLGTTVIAETCPHYLLHVAEDDPENVLLKYTPPLRYEADRDAMWRGIAEGEIECVGSDHVPNRLAAKRGTGFWSAIVGGGGLETMLPVLMHEGVSRGRIAITHIAEIMSAGPARAFGVYPRKGVIAVGADADLTVVDADRERTVRIAELESRNETDWSPLEGRTLRGWPVATIRRGELIARDGAAIEARPGRYLSRTGMPAPSMQVV